MVALFDIPFKSIGGKDTALRDYQAKVFLIVNVASKCGFTPQYEGLEALWRRYKDKGLVVLGFPCNQFGAQEPGNAAEIQNFCKLSYDVTFPLMDKIDVNGAHAHPFYEALKKKAPGFLCSKSIKWNFTKFVVSADGSYAKRYAPKDSPETLAKAIEELL